MRDVSLSVVIPAFNEEANLETTVVTAVETLRALVSTFEIIVIDDKSTDGTAAIADDLAARFGEVRVIHNEHNLRQGACLKLGFAKTRMDVVTHNGADYPFDYSDLPELLERLPTASVIVASRASYPGVSAPRRFVSWVNGSLIRLLFRVPVRDYNFIQLYKREALVEPSSTATSFITPEMIIRAHHAGYGVVEVEVPYRARPTGKPSSLKLSNVWLALVGMYRLWRELRVSRARQAPAHDR